MRVTSAQPRIFWGRTGFLEQGRFDKHFMYDIQKKGSAGKNIRDFFSKMLLDFSPNCISNENLIHRYTQNKKIRTGESSPLYPSCQLCAQFIFLKKADRALLYLYGIVQIHMDSSDHIGLTDNNGSRYRMWTYQINSPCSLR